MTTVLFAKHSPSKQATALHMLDVMNKNHYVEKLMTNMAKIQIRQNPLLRAQEQKVLAFFLKHSSFQKLKPQLAALYAKEFSLSEMHTFTNFCKTKDGQRILLKMPRIIQLSSNLGERNIQKHYPELINSLMK